jgi:hypothetical protein
MRSGSQLSRQRSFVSSQTPLYIPVYRGLRSGYGIRIVHQSEQHASYRRNRKSNHPRPATPASFRNGYHQSPSTSLLQKTTVADFVFLILYMMNVFDGSTRIQWMVPDEVAVRKAIRGTEVLGYIHPSDPKPSSANDRSSLAW